MNEKFSQLAQVGPPKKSVKLNRTPSPNVTIIDLQHVDTEHYNQAPLRELHSNMTTHIHYTTSPV